MFLALVLTACSPDSDQATLPLGPQLQRVAETEVRNDAILDWSTLSDSALWSYVVKADSLVDVGLKLPGAAYGMTRGRVLLSRDERLSSSQALTAIPGVVLLSSDTLLPIASVRLKSERALSLLREVPTVSYVEPGKLVDNPGKPWADESGCSVSLYDGPGGSTQTASGDVLPWNFLYMEIDQAWTKSNGAGVLVGLVDTGIDAFQPELTMPGFAGSVSGKYIVSDATTYSAGIGDDDCGHGTRLAGVIAAPMNGALTAGVAWGASLYSVRVDNDVIMNNVDYTRLGIRRVSDNGARIINISLGTYAYYSAIADEIAWHRYNRDRLFFVAAGTSACWDGVTAVSFPGTLSTVTTVTALDQTGAVACNAHYGPAVDFAAFSNQPTTGFGNMLSAAGVGGSSNATAVLSGISALILAKHPSYSRSQVLTALISSAMGGGLRHDIGYGAVNALCAVDGFCEGWIDGTALIENTGSYTFTAQQRRSAGPFSYQWSRGETTPSITRQVNITYGMQEYNMELSVVITDLSDGRSKSVNKFVVVRQPNAQCPTCF